MTIKGDTLAAGGKSAQFGGAQSAISDFEGDLIFRPEIVQEKYGLSLDDLERYVAMRERGEKLPDLPTLEIKKEMGATPITVIDRRLSFLPDAVSVEEVKPEFEEKEYESFKPILDRVLVKRIADDPNLEQLSDGSMRDKRTGFIIPAKYRQHSNIGIVLAVGDFVVIGNVKTPMRELVRPGDRVRYGDYNSEVFHMPEYKIKELCDAVRMNYVTDEEGLRIVRVQDIRGIERPI
jgi:co-chaperonin GroES (HSP10)